MSADPNPAPATVAAAVDAFLAAVAAGTGMPAQLWAVDATLDATVPDWRFSLRGSQPIAEEYGRWFSAPGTFEELNRLPVPDGEVVTYLLTWTEEGVPHAAHHCHTFRFDGAGRISSEVVFCGGRWPASLLAQMADES